MKYRFIGGKETANFYGIHFNRGEPVEVDETAVAFSLPIRKGNKRVGERDVLIIDKIKNHSEFEAVEDTVPRKVQMQMQCDEAGISYDARWGEKRLEEALNGDQSGNQESGTEEGPEA